MNTSVTSFWTGW